MISSNGAIAVVGLGVRLPGADSARELIRNTLVKRCFVRDLPSGLWERDVFYSEDRNAALRTYSALAALTREVDPDVSAFRIPPAVARRTSRSQKLALLCARDALADAGLYPDGPRCSLDRESFGVVVAAVPGGEASEANGEAIFAQRFQARLRRLAQDGGPAAELEALLARYEEHFPTVPITEDSLPGESAGIVAGRIASAFDLHGPNLSVESACASTLAAVGVAVDALRTGQCDAVLTGGVETAVGAEAFVKFAKIQALSGEGAFVFDQRADGFVIGEGCGILVLRRLSDAVRDGQRIYGLIRGYGSASDGAGKGISAPDSAGQLRAL
ncbi:MAG: polyketide synthase, partial [Holophagales bacterium]|nr:polyketide synthase [Holophagales bacterium]